MGSKGVKNYFDPLDGKEPTAGYARRIENG
jgi:hypothetical protein